jgi:hypothetical protein
MRVGNRHLGLKIECQLFLVLDLGVSELDPWGTRGLPVKKLANVRYSFRDRVDGRDVMVWKPMVRMPILPSLPITRNPEHSEAFQIVRHHFASRMFPPPPPMSLM